MFVFNLLIVTVLCCFSLAGDYVPGEIIYKLRATGQQSSSVSKTALRAPSTVSPNASLISALPYKVLKQEQLFPNSAGARTLNLKNAGVTPQDTVGLDRVYKLSLSSTTDMQQTLQWLAQRPDVEYAQPNNYYQLNDTVPNDNYYQLFQKSVYDLYQMSKAWDICTGSSSVVVGVVDSGVDSTHPDLIGKVLSGRNFVANNYNPADDNGHGTHVSGIIAANSNNTVGVTGMAWNVQILPVKSFNSGGQGTDADIVAGIVYAVDSGAKVINMSFGSYTDSSILSDAITYAFNADRLLVAAAGNDNRSLNTSPCYPVCYDGASNMVLGVASIGTSYKRSSFSNYGSGTLVDVCAVGEDICSTYPSSLSSNISYAFMSGTSMATPMVSGLAALIFSYSAQHSLNLNATSVNNLIRNYARSIDGYNLSNYSNQLGNGVINAYRILNALQNQVTPNNVVFYNWPNPIHYVENLKVSTQFHIADVEKPQAIKITLYSLRGVRLKSIKYDPVAIVTETEDFELTDEAGLLLPTGIYIAVLEMTDFKGQPQKKYHKVVIK